MTIKEIIWLAGFIDGEGYIGVVKKGTRYQSQVRIATTHKETMEYVAKLLEVPCGVHKPSKGNGKWKSCYRAVVYDKRAEELCKELLPYLRTKKAQAKNLIKFRETIKYGRNQYSSPRNSQTPFWLKSKELNLRGLDIV